MYVEKKIEYIGVEILIRSTKMNTYYIFFNIHSLSRSIRCRSWTQLVDDHENKHLTHVKDPGLYNIEK